MVSEKLIIILITLAILFSIASIVITISSVNVKSLPEIRISENTVPDLKSGQVGIIINKPTVTPDTSEK